MGDFIVDGAEYSCTLGTCNLKLKVFSSPVTADGKKVANTGNCFFPPPPGGMCNISSPPIPCAPVAAPVASGQKPNQISQMPALGMGSKFQCARGGAISVSSPGQSKAKHEEATPGPTASEH